MKRGKQKVVPINDATDIFLSRKAGGLAAQVLAMLTPHVQPGVSTEHHQSRSGRMSVLGERHGGVRGELTQTQSNDQGSGPPREGGKGGRHGADGCADGEQQGQRRRLWQLASADPVRGDSESSRSGTDSCPPEGRGLLGCSHWSSQV